MQPPRSPEQRLAQAVASMVPGTLAGRVASARPVPAARPFARMLPKPGGLLGYARVLVGWPTILATATRVSFDHASFELVRGMPGLACPGGGPIDYYTDGIPSVYFETFRLTLDPLGATAAAVHAISVSTGAGNAQGVGIGVNPSYTPMQSTVSTSGTSYRHAGSIAVTSTTGPFEYGPDSMSVEYFRFALPV